MKRILAVLLVISFVCIPLNAENNRISFKDSNKFDWAEKYINNIAEKGIIKGYDDGEFKPSKNVTKCNALLMMYRTLKYEGVVDDRKEAMLAEKYKDIMNKADLPTYKGLRESIAYFLEEKIVQSKDLASFMISQKSHKEKFENSMNREELCFYLGQVLNKELNGNINALIKVNLSKLKDADKIFGTYRAHITLLVDKGIVSGDSNGNFNPKNNITRAEFSKLMYESINVLDNNKKKNTITLKAEIKKVDEKNRKITFFFVDKNLEKVRNIDEDVKITLNKKPATMGNLEVGMMADVVYYENAISEVNASKIEEETRHLGTVDKVDRDKKIIYYKEKSNYKNTQELAYDIDTKIFLDKKSASVSSIRNGQLISADYKNDQLTAIDLISKKKIFRGLITDLDLSNNKISISNDEFTSDFDITNDTRITNNGKKEVFENLKIGNKAVLTSEYGKIVKLDCYPNNKVGTINAVSKGDPSKNTSNSIDVLFEDDEIKNYEVKDSVKITINGKPANQVFDLKVNSSVSLSFDGKDLIKIDARSFGNKLSLTGYVKSVDVDEKMIQVDSIGTQNSELRSYDLILKKATIIDQNGRRGNIKDIKEWQKVYFYGDRARDDDSDTLIKVEKLIILEKADYNDEN